MPTSTRSRITTFLRDDVGERRDRCQWQIKGAERVAAVDKIEDKRKPDDFIGYRNRTSSPTIRTALVKIRWGAS